MASPRPADASPAPEAESDAPPRIHRFCETEIRRQAISMHRAFAPVRALLGEAELLALNASVACGRLGPAGRTFATVARDLHSSSATLRLRIDDVETAFYGIASLVAQWSQAEQAIRIMQRSLDDVRQAQSGRPVGEWGVAWAPETRKVWSAHAREATKGFESALWVALMRHREHLTSTIAELHYQIIALERHMDRIRWAAVRQTRYLHILANIERAHLHEQGRAVDAVVQAMARLDERISTLEQAARDKVDALQTRMNMFSRAIWPGRSAAEREEEADEAGEAHERPARSGRPAPARAAAAS